MSVAFAGIAAGAFAKSLSNFIFATSRPRTANDAVGPDATPDDIRFTESLPKTRSGKIMRRLLKQIAAGQAIVGDTTTLEDFSILAKLSAVQD